MLPEVPLNSEFTTEGFQYDIFLSHHQADQPRVRRRAEMWRNATVFTATAGGKCGLFLHEFAEGRGRLILVFPDEHASAKTRFHFEEFVLAHARLSPGRDLRE